VEQIDNDKRQNVSSLKLTSLKKDQTLNSINGPVMLCTCAQLGRATGSSDASTLSVMCPSFTNAVGRVTRVAASCWVGTGIGDSRHVATFPHGSLANQHLGVYNAHTSDNLSSCNKSAPSSSQRVMKTK
jgi:hypothetical protein